MENKNSWDRLFDKMRTSGISVEEVKEETPMQKINKIGKDMRIREVLKKEGAGIPKYSKVQAERIQKQMDKAIEENKLQRNY